jgi:hypothetical protein
MSSIFGVLTKRYKSQCSAEATGTARRRAIEGLSDEAVLETGKCERNQVWRQSESVI